MTKIIVLSLIFLVTSCDDITKSKKRKSPILWETSFETPKFESSFPSYFATDNSVYLARSAGLNKYNAINGELIWRKEFNYQLANSVNKIYIDDDYIYSTPRYEFSVFNHHGKLVYNEIGKTYDGRYQSVLRDGTFYVEFDHKLRAFDKKTLTFIDNYPLDDKIIQNYTIDQNTLYISVIGKNKESKESSTGGIYAIDLSTKEILWQFDVEPETQGSDWQLSGFNHASIVYEDKVINASNSSTEGLFDMYCLSADSGKVLWQREGFIFEQKPPMIDNIIYIVSNSEIIAVDANTGNSVWETQKYGANSSAIYVYKDYLYFVNNSIYVMDPLSGEFLYEYDLHNGITKESISFGDDKVFVNGYDRLYTLKAYHVLND